MIKRILVIGSCVALLVCVFALPASAAPLDYNDYITNVTVDGDNDIVTVSFPVDNAEFWLHYSDTVVKFTGNSLSHNFANDKPYGFQIFPLGDNDLLISNIPVGTVVTLVIKNDATDMGWMDITSAKTSAHIQYYGSSMTQVPVSFVSSYELYGTEVQFTLEKPNNATSASVYYYIYGIDFHEAGVKTFSVTSYTLTMSISSLYRLQQETGKTNVILKEVEKQLADQGKTLDEVLGAQKDTNEKLDGIINDKVDSTPPSGGGAVGDLDDAEGHIRDDAQSGLDQGLDVQQSALQILQQYWSAFACVGWIFNLFADLPFFSGLLYVSFALGITGAILGLGLSLARAGDARAARQAAAEARQNSYYRRLGRGRNGG